MFRETTESIEDAVENTIEPPTVFVSQAANYGSHDHACSEAGHEERLYFAAGKAIVPV